MKKCPYCAEEIQDEANVCRYCGHDLLTIDRMPTLSQGPTENNKFYASYISIILGVFSLVAWLLPFCGLPISILGVIAGIIGLGSNRRGTAIAGVVVSIIGILLSIINSVVGGVLGYLGLLDY